MIQLDSCAAIELVIAEAESAALVDWLAERDEPIMGSGLLRVELLRALARIDAGEQSREAASGLLDRLHLHPVDAVLHDAALLEGNTCVAWTRFTSRPPWPCRGRRRWSPTTRGWPMLLPEQG